jgi:hypothetical protein
MVEGTKGSHHKGGSTKMAKRTTICAGIDTGKRKLDIALDGSSEQLQIDNTPEGYKALLDWLRRHRVKRIGIEASGGYEQAVVVELRRKRFVVVVFQPAQVRAYAKFRLQRAKNDKIDAALIAACTGAVKTIHAPPDARLLPFAEHLTMIDQIAERYHTSQESHRDLPQLAFQPDLEGGYRPARTTREDRVQSSGGGYPQASRSRRAARPDQQCRWYRAADRRCHPGALAGDWPDYP